jgi:transcriptional regulator NrdR family protein
MEVPSRVIGDMVLAKLKELDPVAYIRFASVYRDFSDTDTFVNTIKGLKQEQKLRAKKVKYPDLISTFLNVASTKN